jgi:hypothetical protein
MDHPYLTAAVLTFAILIGFAQVFGQDAGFALLFFLPFVALAWFLSRWAVRLYRSMVG